MAALRVVAGRQVDPYWWVHPEEERRGEVAGQIGAKNPIASATSIKPPNA
jgi:hypothetical protein